MRGFLLLLFLPAALPAQVVRGIVRDSASGEPAAGVLVALVQRPSGERRTVLTDADGRFVIGASGAGSYALETKRIGVRPALSAEFLLSVGESREVSVTIAPVVAVLEAVRVTGRSYCGDHVSRSAETATFWEEVRAALIATRLTRERQGFPVTLTSFKRTLHPATFEVQSEERTERSGVTSNPFRGAPLANLSERGYVVPARDGSLQYYAPDVDGLLSDTFIRDHCFRAVVGTNAPLGLVGLSFEPTSARRVPDIAGILWIEARTRQLKRLEFHYTRHPIDFDGRLPISYIDFARMPSGGWIVQRWAIRMPHVAASGPSNRASSPMVAVEPPRTRLLAILEEGGEALIGVRQASRAMHAVEGAVFDSSSGRPLSGARVFVRGTPFTATADAAGRFRIQLADTGSYLFAFEHPRLDSLGFDVPSRSVRVVGSLTTADIAVPPLPTVRATLCPSSTAADRTGIVHGVVRKADGAPLSWGAMTYRWTQSASAAGNPQYVTFVADSRGRYVICDVPPGQHRLTLQSETGEIGETDVRIEAGELVMRAVTLRRR